MGAQIAELAAIAARARVKGLVLLAPVPLAGVNAPPEVVASFKRVGGDAVLQRETRRNLSFKLSQEAEALLGEFGDVVKPATVAALVDAWNNGDPAGTVASPFTGPVLVVRGADDPFCYRRHGQGVAQRFTHAQIQRVAQGGHWPHVEQQPARVAALLADYLKTLSPALFSRLRFIGIRSVATLTVEQTWDGRAADMIDAGKRQAAKLAGQF